MTNLQEAKLAREAEICYATMALVTDYDVWYEGSEDVTPRAGARQRPAQRRDGAVHRASGGAGARLERDCGCHHAVEHAINTPAELIPAATREKLDLLSARTFADARGFWPGSS